MRKYVLPVLIVAVVSAFPMAQAQQQKQAQKKRSCIKAKLFLPMAKQVRVILLQKSFRLVDRLPAYCKGHAGR